MRQDICIGSADVQTFEYTLNCRVFFGIFLAFLTQRGIIRIIEKFANLAA